MLDIEEVTDASVLHIEKKISIKKIRNKTESEGL